MHAIFITFRSAATAEDLAEPFLQYASALRDGASPVFCSKTWVADDDLVGGFHLFDSGEAADRCLQEMFGPNVAANPAFSDFRIERFEVNEHLSGVTGGLPARESPRA